MKPIKSIIVLSLTLLLCACVNSQRRTAGNSTLVGGPCEGCEAIFEYGDQKLTATATLPDFEKEGIKLKVTGTIYQEDGKTPAKDVILYLYQTNPKGIYATKGGETGWARRHGYIRGWVKTGNDGRYTFYTLKPGTYPSRTDPAHIHPTVLEPNGKYYYIHDYYFEGDPLLTDKEIAPKSPRGGNSGVLSLIKEGDLWVGKRDFILGTNIPDYK